MRNRRFTSVSFLPDHAARLVRLYFHQSERTAAASRGREGASGSGRHDAGGKGRREEAAQKLDEASKKLAHQAEVVGQGVKEGWDRDSLHSVDLNTAGQADLRRVLGLSEEDARKIITGRPYKSTHELVAQGIISEDKFREIGNRIVVKNSTP
jgi:DNA uptake protein ComE-like DNA-binding protein